MGVACPEKREQKNQWKTEHIDVTCYSTLPFVEIKKTSVPHEKFKDRT
jgi:hypothetical protein